MHLSYRTANLFISLQILLAGASLVSKTAAFAEDPDPLRTLSANKKTTKGTQVGDVHEVNISSTYNESEIKPVTSEDGKTDTYTLTHTDASYISVHFHLFDLPSSCLLDIRDEKENKSNSLTGKGKLDLGSFWAHHVNGDTMKLSLICDKEEDKESALFEIDQFAAGFPLNNNPITHPNERHLRSHTKEEKIPSFLKAIDEQRKLSICGADDKRNAICYKDSQPSIYNKARAVARLLINGRFACTGWLVSGGSLLFTNEHCIASLSDVQNTDFEFMAEEPNCAIGSSDGSWFSSRNFAGIYDGSALLQVSASWDYALVQLDGNPANTYGFLELDNRRASVNEEIYIPQHPAGRPKEIGVFDSEHNDNCKVKDYVWGCAPEDMRYTCDTEGGSSGSPVLSRTNNKVIALHHCGGGCNGNQGAPIYAFYDLIQGFIDPPGPAPSSSPTFDLCSVVDMLDQTLFLAGAGACWRVQLGTGGTLEADATDPTCSKNESEWRSTRGIFSLFDSIRLPANIAVFNPGPNGYSGTFQFKENPTVTGPSLVLLNWDEPTKQFTLQVDIPNCLNADAICPTMKINL